MRCLLLKFDSRSKVTSCLDITSILYRFGYYGPDVYRDAVSCEIASHPRDHALYSTVTHYVDSYPTYRGTSLTIMGLLERRRPPAGVTPAPYLPGCPEGNGRGPENGPLLKRRGIYWEPLRIGESVEVVLDRVLRAFWL